MILYSDPGDSVGPSSSIAIEQIKKYKTAATTTTTIHWIVEHVSINSVMCMKFNSIAHRAYLKIILQLRF